MKSIKESENKKNTVKYVSFEDIPRKKVANVEEYARENGYIPLEELFDRINKLI